MHLIVIILQNLMSALEITNVCNFVNYCVVMHFIVTVLQNLMSALEITHVAL